jgi:transcriptional regulator with XRE-family HTH domain
MQNDYDLCMKWNDRLLQARDAAGASNTDIAKVCKVSNPSVTDWMNGETKKIDAAYLLAACKFLKVSPFWVMNGEDADVTQLPASIQVSASDVVNLVTLFAKASDTGKRFILNAAEIADEN